MHSILEIEHTAAKLRRCLQNEHSSPEIRILCGLRFFAQLQGSNSPAAEPYLREFVPLLAAAAVQSNPREFLPDDHAQLASLSTFLSKISDQIVATGDIDALSNLAAATLQVVPSSFSESGVRPENRHAVSVRCLFVEDYPELGLQPRGRILTLNVTALPLQKKHTEDDIVVHNPVERPDDRFLAQARDSVLAARAYLAARYGVPLSKRFQFKFELNSRGARFTGDSLGVAFAVGAVTAVEKVELFRERLNISPRVAFSGALSPEGKLLPIDRDGLRLKIVRAFHSELSFLVVPRDHITEAWQIVKELEAQQPGRKLDMMGADQFAAVADDPRFLERERLSLTAYAARRAWKAKRSTWVELPALVVLIGLLAWVLLAPWLDKVPAKIRTTQHGFDVLNKYSRTLWSRSFGCELFPDSSSMANCTISDIDGDGFQEVLYMPFTTDASPVSGWLFVYRAEGDTIFSRDCSIRLKYPGDSVPEGKANWYEAPGVHVMTVTGDVRIVTRCAKTGPARGYLKIWDAKGNQLSWYIQGGWINLVAPYDVDGDGRDELVGWAFANRMKALCFLALPADSCRGVSPPYWNRPDGDFDLSWVERGSQIHYVVFPVSEVGKIDLAGPYPWNLTFRRNSHDEWVIWLYERATNTGDVLYYLNARFRATSVLMTDAYRKRRQILILRDSLPNIPDGVYSDSLLNRVTYWDRVRDGWVTEGQLRAESTLSK